MEDTIIGFVSIWEVDKFIHNLFVRKDFRRMGVGHALLNEVVKNYELPLTLKCVRANIGAVEFYLTNNWQIIKEEIGPGGPYYLMKLEKI